MNVGPQAIGYVTCKRMGWDDGSWSKWVEPAPGGRTYHVCHQCLSSPQSYWKGLFSLCQKSGVGTVHLSQSEQSTASELEELCIASQQQPEDISVAEQYQKFEDPFDHSPLDPDQIRLLSLLPKVNDVLCTIEKPTSTQQLHSMMLYHTAGELTSSPNIPSGSMVILSRSYGTFTLLLDNFASQYQRVSFGLMRSVSIKLETRVKPKECSDPANEQDIPPSGKRNCLAWRG